MKKLLSFVLVLGSMSFAGCTFGPYHTSESGLLEKLFLPSEMEARTRYYEKNGMSKGDAMHRAYKDVGSDEQWYYSSEAASMQSRELTRDDMEGR